MRALRLAAWAAVGVVVVAVAGLFTYQSFYRSTENSLSADVRLGAPFRLVDHNGEPITEAALAGHPSAVFFGFTHCPEVCPTTLYELSAWFDDLGGVSDDIGVFFVTVDPERDTPELLKAYLSNFSDRFVGITGDPGEVAQLAKAWRVYFKKVPLDDENYTMDHTASIYLVDPGGRFMGTIGYGENRETALLKLKRLAASAGS